MAVIVVAASTAASTFSVINFENNSPRSASVTGYGGGNVVDCYGVLAAVGDVAGGSFTLFNLLIPSSPIWVSVCDTGLSSISAIAISDKYVLACGMAPPDNPETEGTDPVGTVVLVDISNPIAPSVVSTYQQLWLGVPTSCAIRGTTGVVGGWMPNEVGPTGTTPSVLATFDYTNPANPEPNTLDTVGTSDLTAPLLSGPLLVDYDGTMVIATNAAPGGYTGSGAYLYTISSDDPLSTVGGGGASVAVAEIPDGGYYVAIGQAYTNAGVGGFYTIQAFPDDAPSGIVNGPTLEPSLTSEATVVRFLNNPAVAPYLAVANVAASGRMFVRLNFLFLETGGLNGTTIQIGTPVPVAQIMLPGTGGQAVGTPPAGITLGITALTPLTWPPFHFPLPPIRWW